MAQPPRMALLLSWSSGTDRPTAVPRLGGATALIVSSLTRAAQSQHRPNWTMKPDLSGRMMR